MESERRKRVMTESQRLRHELMMWVYRSHYWGTDKYGRDVCLWCKKIMSSEQPLEVQCQDLCPGNPKVQETVLKGCIREDDGLSPFTKTILKDCLEEGR